MNERVIQMLAEGTVDTVYMTLVSTLFGYIIGLPVGVILTVSDKDGIKPNAVLYRILDVIINIMRSIPSFPDSADPSDPLYKVSRRQELRDDRDDRSADDLCGALHRPYGGILPEGSQSGRD